MRRIEGIKGLKDSRFFSNWFYHSEVSISRLNHELVYLYICSIYSFLFKNNSGEDLLCKLFLKEAESSFNQLLGLSYTENELKIIEDLKISSPKLLKDYLNGNLGFTSHLADQPIKIVDINELYLFMNNFSLTTK